MTIALIIIGLLIALFLLGPRARASDRVSYRRGELGRDPVETLARREARFTDIRPGLAREIVWRDPTARDRRPWAVVNIHGFSASKQELRPLPDIVAEALDANLYFTRLAGHGRPATAMAEPSADDWLDDMAEALEVGRLLGDRVLVLGMSTGATLAAWAAMRDDMRHDMDAIIFISPNFEIRRNGTRFLTIPWARQLLRLFMGQINPVREGDNPAFSQAWTTGYPAEALLPMAAAVHHVKRLRLEETTQPALFIHSPNDQVISVPHVHSTFQRWGGAPKAMIQVTDAEDGLQHIIAGDIVSPTPTRRLADQVVDWVRSLPAN